MRRGWGAGVVLAAGALVAALLPPAGAGAQESLRCPPDDGVALTPGECKTYAYRITNTSGLDGTFFTRILRSSLEVVDENDQPVSEAERDAFLSSYFTVTWDRHPWVSVPDPQDAARTAPQRTGGIDVLVEPLPREYCPPRPITDETRCRLGRIHRAGSRSLAGQPTDSRTAFLVISFSADALGTPQQDWRLVSWTVNVTAAAPASSDCPTPEVQNVCTSPVYER